MSKKPKYEYTFLVRQRYMSYSDVSADTTYILHITLDKMSVWDAEAHAKRLAEKATPTNNYKVGVELLEVEEK